MISRSFFNSSYCHDCYREIVVQVGSIRPERSIPDTILRHAKGLAILTVVKVGLMATYNIGTGLVIARKEDGSWSAPSAISSFGVGWGAQVIHISFPPFYILAFYVHPTATSPSYRI